MLLPCDESQERLPASRALADFAFRNLVIDPWSIRDFHLSAKDRDVRLPAFEAPKQFLVLPVRSFSFMNCGNHLVAEISSMGYSSGPRPRF